MPKKKWVLINLLCFSLCPWALYNINALPLRYLPELEKKKYPRYQDHSSIFENFWKICYPSLRTWEIKNLLYVPGHSKFVVLQFRHKPEVEKWSTHAVRIAFPFFGIFWKYAVFLLGLGKTKISSMTLGTPKLIPSLRDTYRS